MSRLSKFLSLTLLLASLAPIATHAELKASPIKPEGLLCLNAANVNYQEYIRKYLRDYKNQLQKEFDRQADFRLRAAKTKALKATRQKALAKQKADVLKQIDEYEKVQAKSLSDVGVLFTSTSTVKSVKVSAPSLDKSLDASQKLFLGYADKKDQAIITSVWKKRRENERKLLEQAINQERVILQKAIEICKTNPPKPSEEIKPINSTTP